MIPDTYKFNKVYSGSVEKLQDELSVLTLNNIKKYRPYKVKWDDFYSMWLRFGPEAARTILIPYIWDGRFPSPSEVRHARQS
mgnify:CR=1 FL=1